MHPRTARKQHQQTANQPTRAQVSRHKRTKNKWPTRLQEFRSLLGTTIPVATKVLVLLLVLLAIGIVANAIGRTFHLVHSAVVADHLVRKYFDEL
jgi:hypothetical protein